MIRRADVDDRIRTDLPHDAELPPRLVRLMAELLVRDVMRDEAGDSDDTGDQSEAVQS